MARSSRSRRIGLTLCLAAIIVAVPGWAWRVAADGHALGGSIPILDPWADPLVLTILVGLSGIVVWHVIPSRRVNTRLVVQIPFFLTMSAMLIAWHVDPTAPPDGDAPAPAAILVAIVKLLWWLHLAWALIGVVRITLVIEHRPREARLLQQVVVGVVYAGMVLAILAFVFAVPVATLIATSGAIAVVFGLALQSTLADVFSGIALNLGRPYRLGDWIGLSDGTEGRVVETNWRSTLLLDPSNNLVILPNSFLAKLGITNVSTPNETHGLSITLRIAPTRRPGTVVEVMQAVLQSSDLIVREPPPAVAIKGIDAAAIELGLIFSVSEVGRRLLAKNEIYDLLYRHLQAAGLLLAAPPSMPAGMTAGPSGQMERPAAASPIDLIAAIPVFAALDDEEQQELAATATLRTFRKGEVIARQDEVIASPMIVRSGVVSRDNGDGPENKHGHLAPGDLLGLGGILAGKGEDATLRAAGRVTVHVLARQAFASLLDAHPELADDLASLLPDAPPAAGDATAPQDHTAATAALLRKIKRVIHV